MKEQPNEIVVGILITYHDGHTEQVDKEIIEHFEDFRYHETGAEAIGHLLDLSDDVVNTKASLNEIQRNLNSALEINQKMRG